MNLTHFKQELIKIAKKRKDKPPQQQSPGFLYKLLENELGSGSPEYLAHKAEGFTASAGLKKVGITGPLKTALKRVLTGNIPIDLPSL